MKELVIKDLHVSVEDKEILKGVSLTVGEPVFRDSHHNFLEVAF